MARKYRISYPGMYHIINRGVGKRNVFLADEDHEVFLALLGEILEKYNITLHTYCLMTNHYHLLLETYEENLSEAIKYLNGNYAIYFNKKYKRPGHLWQGRFLSYYLYDDVHFWIVAKYIEQNPVKAHMVKEISEYKYQSFFQWKHKDLYFKLLKNSMIFDMTIDEYETYIRTEMPQIVLDQVYRSPKVITRNGVTKVLTKRLEIFFEKDRDINRNKNMQKAYEYGYSKTEIAAFVGLSSKSMAKLLG